MRTVTWLHISDFHLRESHAWSQDAVLSAMRADIERRQKAGLSIDFILATGDLAFSGKKAEYDLARSFFEELSATTSVLHDRMFCIPGNHDVDRSRQTMAFAGARLRLQSEGKIYAFLSNIEERETLLKRLENFRTFQDSWSPAHARTWTPDGLGYVSVIEIEDMRIGIVGLNSAWLSEGDISDHGNLLLGESQVREALRLVREKTPHIVVAMGHHPLMLLQNFDRAPTQGSIENTCQFFHCGHLHEPDAHDTVRGTSRCLTLSAGASFDSREFHNAYTVVTLDPMRAARTVTFVQFNPHVGEFTYAASSEYPLEIDAPKICSIGDLGIAIQTYVPSASCPFYLAALLLNMKSEVPIAEGSTFVFGTADVAAGQANGELKSGTSVFFTVGNILRLFSASMSVSDILTRHGQAVRDYTEVLEKCCKTDTSLRDKLGERELDARALAKVEPRRPFEHTLSLLDALRNEGDWDHLQEQAIRLVNSPTPEVGLKARRMLALCLGRSTERADHDRAIEILRQIDDEGTSESGDIATLVTILIKIEDFAAAKAAVLSGMDGFPDSEDGFASIGMKIVEATGDLEFRNKLKALGAGRRA